MAIENVTIENFESILAKSDIFVLDAWASWCGPCRAFAPVFEAAAARHPKVTWGKLDTESQSELAGAFGIRAIPTLMVFREGVLLLQQSGMVPGRTLDEIVAKARALDMTSVRAAIAQRDQTHASRA